MHMENSQKKTENWSNLFVLAINLLDFSPTAVPQNRETPRGYMTFNKFTRDECVLRLPLLFFAHTAP